MLVTEGYVKWERGWVVALLDKQCISFTNINPCTYNMSCLCGML